MQFLRQIIVCNGFLKFSPLNWKSHLSLKLIVVIFLCCNFCDSKTKSHQSHSNNKKDNSQSHPSGRSHNVKDSEEGRVRKSAKYTEETLAIGKESYNNLLIYEARKKGRVSIQYSPKIESKHPLCHRPKISCDSTHKYRRIDGRCNNLQHSEWGSSFTPFARLVPVEYADGFNKPKGEPPHKVLPDERRISIVVHTDQNVEDQMLTNMIPQVGQFLDHDLTLAPEGDRRCCTTEKDGIDCWPMTISKDDPFYSNLKNKQTCMDFTRSTAFCFPGGSGTREQFNVNTAFVDASHIYGSDDDRAKYVRELKEGRLLHGNEFPDLKIPPSIAQISKIQGKTIKVSFMGKLMGGDNRINETPGLTVMHTLFMREHNKLAKEIASSKPDWKDEKIYQEARRINSAQWQNIIYAHFLPLILSPATMKKYKLDLGKEDSFSEYISSLDPTIYHSFATAALRFGHSMVNGLYRLFKGQQEVGSFALRHTFFNASHIETPEAYDLTLGGLMIQNSQVMDRFVAEDVTNFLFKMGNDDFGSDLVARNIRRGRDHGIANYNTYRQICGLDSLTTWDNKPPEFDPVAWEKLKSVYDLPSDIELFPAGISERVLPDAVTGTTFNCLKAMQFYVLKYGDRFFFTHRKQIGSFEKNQLKVLRKRTLGDIICENSVVKRTTKNVFLIPSDISNPWISCEDSSRQKINVQEFVY